MAVQWNSFREGTNDRRFLLPLSKFTYTVQYVPTALNAARMTAVAEFLTTVVFNAIRTVDDCPLSALSIVPGKPEAEDIDREDVERAYFSIANECPVYDFGLQIGPTTMRLTKLRTSLQDLVATLPILAAISEQLFSIGCGDTGTGNSAPNTLPHLMGIVERIHRVVFNFELRLTLGTHIAEQHDESTNVELLDKLIKTSLPLGVNDHPERYAPIAGLQPERVWRGDVSYAFSKTFGEKQRDIWIDFKGPYNITQKDLDLKFQYRCGDTGSASVDAEDLINWETPLVPFYRDMILNRFMPAFFYDIRVETRL